MIALILPFRFSSPPDEPERFCRSCQCMLAANEYVYCENCICLWEKKHDED